ncbi:MAG: hypothetical protein ACPF81_06940, partial [Marinobacterium sp.]
KSKENNRWFNLNLHSGNYLHMGYIRATTGLQLGFCSAISLLCSDLLPMSNTLDGGYNQLE